MMTHPPVIMPQKSLTGESVEAGMVGPPWFRILGTIVDLVKDARRVRT